MPLRHTSTSADLVTEMLHRVADLEDVDVTELPPIGYMLDVESLHTALASNGVTVEFSYLDYLVTLSSDGTIAVRPSQPMYG